MKEVLLIKNGELDFEQFEKIGFSALSGASEGFISGVGKGIFTVAGPVILYSVVAGTVYGLIYYIVVALV